MLFVLFGTLAIITAGCNLILSIKGKNTDILRFISISLTALTVCAFYWMDAQYVAQEAWDSLTDVVPTANKLCWSGTIASILINGSTFFIKKKKK